MGHTHYISRTVSTSNLDWITWTEGALAGDFDLDNDGVMPPTKCVIDLSQALSQRLGRQMSQMSTFKVDYVSLQLINIDDVADNDCGAEFSGKISWYSPTKHRIDALQLMRQVERHAESSEIDGDSWLLSPELDYKGLRFNWDGDDQVAHATMESFDGLTGSQWDMAELFTVYNAQEGLPVQPNALWTGRTGYMDNIGWTVAYQNNAIDTDGVDASIYQPRSDNFQLNNINAEVLGGLMVIDVTHSSTDSPNVYDDDFNLLVTIGISGWSDI